MAKLKDAIKNLGNKINNKEPEGYYVTDMLKSFGTDLTGTQIEGKGITDVLNDIADNYTGGGGGGANLGHGEFTENGDFNAVGFGYDGWDTVRVNVPTGANLDEAYLNMNGTYTPPEGYDGWNKVIVDVPASVVDTFAEYVNRRGDASSLFANMSISDNDVNTWTANVNWNLISDMSSMFENCSAIENINISAAPTDVMGMFNECSLLQTVSGLNFIDVTDMTDVFSGCSSLSEINITGISVDFDISASTQFTAESLEAIIDNLVDVSNDTPATLTMGSDNLAKLSQDVIDAATAKGWTLA